MGISLDIIGKSYGMLFKNRTLLILGIVGAIVIAVATMFLTAPLMNLQNSTTLAANALSPTFWAEVLVGLIVLGLVGLFISGLIISAASMGDGADMGASFKMAASKYISFLGASIAGGFLSLIAFIPGIVLLSAGAVGYGGAIALVAGIILLIIPGIYISLRLALYQAACIAGGKRAIESVKSSWAITKGNLWSILLVLIVLGIVEGIAGGIANYVNATLGTFVSTLLAYPITIALVLIYQQLAPAPMKAEKTPAPAKPAKAKPKK